MLQSCLLLVVSSINNVKKRVQLYILDASFLA